MKGGKPFRSHANLIRASQSDQICATEGLPWYFYIGLCHLSCPFLNGLEPKQSILLKIKVSHINFSWSDCAVRLKRSRHSFRVTNEAGHDDGLERLKNCWIVTHWNACRAPSCKGMPKTFLASHTRMCFCDLFWIFGWMKRMYGWISNELVQTLDSSFCSCRLRCDQIYFLHYRH